MISVVIATFNDERTLGQTLSALVTAAVDGLVREVILGDAGSTDDTLEIADDAGARVVQGEGPAEARIAQACLTARGDWMLILDADHAAPAGWDQAVVAHIKGGPDRAGYWGKTGPWPFGGKAQAVLVSRRLYDQVGGYGPAFVRRLGGRARRLKMAGR